MEIVKQTINIFRIHKEERMAAFGAALVFCVLNALNVVKHFSTQNAITLSSHADFIKKWHLSGFDPITYSVMSDWNSGYNIYRHPLLAYFVWPFTKLNECLVSLTGYNCAVVITAVLLVFFATYSFLFLSRIFIEVIGTKRKEAYILASLTFSFAFVMLSMMAPDHFGPSMFCLVLTLYLSGKKLQKGKAMNWWQTILMFFFTAGISLNNGLKVFLAALFTRGKRFFRPGYLIIAVLLPSALIWGSARLGYKHFVWPKEMARNEKVKKNREQQLQRLQNQALASVDPKDTARVTFVKDSIKNYLEAKRERRRTMSACYKHTGKPMMKGEFMGWTDVTTNRWDIAVESLFGEGIMLHENYLLGDVLVNRPVIVRYTNWFNYIVEGCLVLMFMIGIWCGRHSRFMWTALSFLMMDMALHMGLGFGINEIFIMSAHYLYVLPICLAYLLVTLNKRWRRYLTISLGGVSVYLAVWNVSLLVQYLFIL